MQVPDRILQEHEFQVTAGSGVIDVRGSVFDAALFLRSIPWLYHCDDCRGSVGQYLLYLATAGDVTALTVFESLLLDPADEDASSLQGLVEVVGPLLATSRYRISLIEGVQGGDDLRHFTTGWNPAVDYSNYYPGFGSFIATQPTDQMDESRIACFQQRIAEGKRPAMLTISVNKGWSNFILDGHHRYLAYDRSKVAPRYVHIDRLDPPCLSQADHAALIPEGHPLRAEALRLKAKCLDWEARHPVGAE